MLLENRGFDRLAAIVNELREKCPWDKKQTIHTLRQQTIEETYELADAITEKDWKGMKEELGDLLLHVLFYATIAREQNQFTMENVIDGICEKLIKRHPHIYGDTEVKDDLEVKRNWEQIKLKEGKQSVLSGVPKTLPAMIKAMRLQDKAKQVGFEWATSEDVWKKIDEEKNELLQAIEEGKEDEVQEEAGDLIFSVINYVRFLNIDAENALEITNKKFTRRFIQMEEIAAASGKNLANMSLEEMDDMWNEIKKKK